ncbi:MAG: alpha-hemolysin [Porticoccaceae bacterium]|nr:alpha-hemolysin [Porticoccaceae bacterium]
MLQRLVLRAIASYQSAGGGRRWFGVECNFEPSCSEYARQSITRFGLRRGLSLALGRLRRCRQPDAVCKCLDPVPATPEDGRNAPPAGR